MIDYGSLPENVLHAVDLVRGSGGDVPDDFIELLCKVDKGEMTFDDVKDILDEEYPCQ